MREERGKGEAKRREEGGREVGHTRSYCSGFVPSRCIH